MDLSADEIRTLRVLSERPAHDTEERPLRVLQSLIGKGLATVAERYYATWGGRRRLCREVRLTDAGRAASPRQAA